ncbi:hypothetical protein HCN44_001105 [Aphidius gifuensis]|uniref:Uncharacterized protein n=1 Tax=Aphidius gifuensis TaxID=684658 RepID=A0A835CLS3_APHGI|nr:hypothetical protein HCN44_001105 [Aphidius gifuensis]
MTSGLDVTTGLSKIAKFGTKAKLKGLVKYSDEIGQVAEKIGDSGLNKESDILEWIKLGTGLATILIPPPAGPLIGLGSAIFFTAYDIFYPKNESETSLQPNPTSSIQITLTNIEKKIDEVSGLIVVQSQRIIDEVKSFFKHFFIMENIQTALATFNSDYTEYYHSCFVSKKGCGSNRKYIVESLVNPSSAARMRYSEFLNAYIIPDKTNPLYKTWEKQSLFRLLLDDYKTLVENNKDCEISPSKPLVNEILVYILTVLGKYRSLIIAAYMRRFITEKKNNYILSISNLIEKFDDETFKIISNAQIALDGTSLEVRSCDPGLQHEIGVTYDRFEFVYPTYIGYVGDCQDDKKLSYGIVTADNDWFKWISLYDCKKIPNAIKASSYYQEKNLKRPLIHHVKISYRNDTTITHGDAERGDGDIKLVHKVNDKSFDQTCTISNHYIGKCKIPFSYKEVKQNEARNISLAPVTASRGYVVTGVRWKFINRTLYLNIQEGRLLNGTILSDTIKWKPIDFNQDNETIVTIGDGEGFPKGFGLADVQLPIDYYVTGVQFDFEKNNSINRNQVIRLNVHGKKFGNINEKGLHEVVDRTWKKSAWRIFNTQIELTEADASEFATENRVLSDTGDFVHFQQTDDVKDAAQTTVPYLDIQEVTKNTPEPLGGIGMYYKGQEGFGGFFALKILVPEVPQFVDLKVLETYTKTIKLLYQKVSSKKQSKQNIMKFIDSIDIEE